MECHLIAATSSSYIHPLSRLLQDRAQGLHAYINYNNRTISWIIVNPINAGHMHW